MAERAKLPPWSALHSLPANLATAMLLTDYALHGAATPTPWAQSAAQRLSAEGQQRLKLLRSPLAHGAVLRAFFLLRLAPEHPAHRSWPELVRWLRDLPPGEVEALITMGIRSGLLWDEPGTGPQVDAALATPEGRLAGLRRVLASWGHPQPEAVVALCQESPRFQAELVALLEELYAQAFRPGWERGEPLLRQAAERALRLSVAGELDGAPGSGEGGGAAGSPEGGSGGAAALVAAVTGLVPSPAWAERLARAPGLLFIPTLHLGRALSIVEEDEARWLVLYEPAPLRDGVPGDPGEALTPGADATPEAAAEPGATPGAPAPEAPDAGPPTGLHLWEWADLGAALVGLGDPNRLAILALLAARGELYGQQIVEQVEVHQSTVSRNMTLLERGRLVHVRREGNIKRYRLNRERIHEVCRLLRGALG